MMPRVDLSIRFSPRIPRRLRAAVGRICRRCDMPEGDVARYCFEAIVYYACQEGFGAVLEQRTAGPYSYEEPPDLRAMMTIRTSKKVRALLRTIEVAERGRLQADIIRTLLEAVLPIAEKNGMSYVMALREESLKVKGQRLK